MKLEDNPQMVAMLDHAKGSLENKIRQAYNSGYNDGFKAGVFEAWNDMREQLNKSLRQQIEQTEPLDKDINVRSKTEPQTNADNAFQNVESVGCDRYVITNDEGERAYNCIGCERTDCSWR